MTASDGLVVESVTTSESPLLFVLFTLWNGRWQGWTVALKFDNVKEGGLA